MKTLLATLLLTLMVSSCSSKSNRYYDSSRSDAVCYRYHFMVPATDCLHLN